MKIHKAFIGYVEGESWLLGGALRHQSAPFELEVDALHWAETCARINREAGRKVKAIGTRETRSGKPILHSEVMPVGE